MGRQLQRWEWDGQRWEWGGPTGRLNQCVAAFYDTEVFPRLRCKDKYRLDAMEVTSKPAKLSKKTEIQSRVIRKKDVYERKELCPGPGLSSLLITIIINPNCNHVLSFF